MDRSSSFDLYKNIANYLGIPITLYKDENLDNSDETYLLSNILDFIMSTPLKTFIIEYTASTWCFNPRSSLIIPS